MTAARRTGHRALPVAVLAGQTQAIACVDL